MRWILAGILTVALTVAGAVWIGRPQPLHLELPSSVVEQAMATEVLNPDRIRAHVTRLAGAPSRVSGYPGADLAARTILDELDNMGLTNHAVQAFTVVVPIVRSASLTATGGPDGPVSIPLHPLWPNLARTCATGPEGITAPLVPVGPGKDADLAGKVLRGAIMVMDWQSNTEWLSVPEFAGRAVIFRASPGTAGVLARNKFLTVPAHIPRFYVEERDLPSLDRLLAAGASQVTVRCEMDWEEVGARNILARVCGGDTPRGNVDTDRAPVVFHAYYDSISVVPDLAPGAEQACSPAVLLELARFLSNLPNKPDRPVYVLFTGGHGQALSGMTRFIRRLQEGIDHGGKDDGADALIARMGRPALFVGIDLASHSDRFGVFAFGNFRGYADWILRPKFSALGLKLDEFAKQQCPLFDPAADLPGFVDAINSSQGRGWNTYFPYPPAFESELPVLIGIPGITLATINDDRKLVDTPDDRLENVNFDLLGRQLVPEHGKRLGLPAFVLALAFWKGPFVAQAIDPKLARVRGRVLWLDQKQDYTPRQPLAKALVFLQANRGISLVINAGEYISIMGPSGSGKSTFFNMIGGLDQPTSGEVYVDDVDIARLEPFELSWLRCRKIGYIFQTFNLIPVMNALENVSLPMVFAGLSADEAREKGARLLELVGLGERIHHRPSEMSGGQQQRVAIARALANDPAIVLADEPTGNLDLQTGHEIIELLKDMKDRNGVTIITATHDMKMLAASDRVVWITDGRISNIQSRSELDIQVGKINNREE